MTKPYLRLELESPGRRPELEHARVLATVAELEGTYTQLSLALYQNTQFRKLIDQLICELVLTGPLPGEARALIERAKKAMEEPADGY